jgi:predicted metallopeptidase
MKYDIAPDIKNQIDNLIRLSEFSFIDSTRIFCIRSIDAKTRAIARIWGFSRLFVEVAGLKPTYIIEVNHKRFDKLPEREKMKTLIHELMHIPKTFSGALRPHKGKGFHICDRTVEAICKRYNI